MPFILLLLPFSNQHIQKFLASIHVPGFIAKPSGEITYANIAFTIYAQSFPPGKRLSLLDTAIFKNDIELRAFVGSFDTEKRPVRHHNPSPDKRLACLMLDTEQGTFLCGLLTHPPAYQPAWSSARRDDDLSTGDLAIPFCKVNGQGKILACSNKFGQLFGQHVGNLLRCDAKLEVASWKKHLDKTTGGLTVDFSTEFRLTDGSILPVHVTLKPMPRESNGNISVTIHDLSREHELQRLLDASRMEIRTLEQEQYRPSPALPASLSRPSLLGRSKGMLAIRQKIERAAPTPVTILITGESGTGKEMIARAIHASSKRSEHPLVIIDCGALPESLIESEFFGHRKGAFTGADRDKKGRFEQANRGTLFLDEIGELPLSLQTRLLRFLQEGTFYPVGADQPLSSDVRVVAATNKDLIKMVAEGTFREDLYYRINIFPIHNPPLRERKDDIGLLARHFFERYGHTLNPNVKTISEDSLSALTKYNFPGNIRELENLVQRALISCEGADLSIHLPEVFPASSSTDHVLVAEPAPEDIVSLDEVQRDHIARVLKIADGKVSGKGGAAELLGMKEQTLYSKIKKLEVER